ncbi:unnamed protein product [Lota lota]
MTVSTRRLNIAFCNLVRRCFTGVLPSEHRSVHIAVQRGYSCTQTAEHIRPLEGVRVLDLTRVLAGPFATMILGDLGAEVIKVEKPGAGDDTRAWGPPFVNNESAYFLSVNRNKKSVAVDLKHTRGAQIILELAAVCDVLVENYLPGKLHQMGLGYEHLQAANPQLVYCSISGFGQTGPQSKSPGYDSIASALSGMMHITGPEGGEPVRPGVAMTDLAAGLYAHGAIMAALLQRQKTGRGVHIDCNLLSSQVRCVEAVCLSNSLLNLESVEQGSSGRVGGVIPTVGFRTKNGYIVVAAGNDKQFVKVCHVLSLTELTEDSNYKTNKLRVKHRKPLLHIISQRFLEMDTADWLRKFEGSGVPVGPINSIREVFSSPQVKHNNLIQEMNHPTAGPISVPGPAVRFSSFEYGSPPRPPPLIGQHTVQVLREALSYSDEVIRTLLESGAAVQNEQA